MRHNKKFNHLGRTNSHRSAMLSNMASSLIESKRITTTVAKAKALRSYVEPLITKAKSDTTHSRRIVFRHLQNKDAVSELFRDVAAKIADRPGGYTRILRTGTRLGDNAEMCIIELVDYNEAMLETKEEAAKPKKRRSRRGGGGAKKSETPAAGQATQSGESAERAEKEEGADDVNVVEDVQPLDENTEKLETEVKAENEPEEAGETKPSEEENKAGEDEEDKKNKE
jgi:large subunit ribosomal protein L17